MSKRKKEERGRFAARRKVEAVMRLLTGEDLDSVSREVGATAATLLEWRDAFLASAEAGLTSREPSAADEENLRLRAKVGELTMEKELLREKAEKLEVNPGHSRWRKSRPRARLSGRPQSTLWPWRGCAGPGG